MGKLYGLIGCPVGHSMSPDIHNDAFSHLHLSAYYHAFHVEKEKLADAVSSLRTLGVLGFNVTVPHKVAIMPLLDEIDESASRIGAVNTVKNKDGKLIGYNTDGIGYLTSLKRRIKKPLSESKVLLIGAGGAARGIYFTLAKEGCLQIDICNRTIEKAKDLISECPIKVKGDAYSIHGAENLIYDYDIIIQTTSIGMHPNTSEKPIELTGAKKECLVSDIIYNPIQTQLLKEAEAEGMQTLTGVGMFVHQAAHAFIIWTGIEPNVARMEKIVINKLGGTSC
ncbi:shikimate dehydrogenase [Metabacillus arenae]|uniref:Shikimate dehydrogenase (NADP(+)) n=1 Tax=Metabacillus arenae TaxID=2771434 RepID=A0A926RYS1_9BACI|nr:shikimate dehydrogenase [Metabacillus arenae]MBD1382070.1 shikimate dehydrogenase [Metabacillus arenae]